MDFARNLLEKYGWKEGQGLGKNEDGISKPLKPKVKLNQHGLGHDQFQDLCDPWWQRMYDKAAKNITVETGDGSVNISTNDESFEITRKKKSKRSKAAKDKSRYDNFIKLSKLTVFGEERLNRKEDESDEDKDMTAESSAVCDVSEKLFKLCNGRTAHKGARHGLKMSAKLARIQKQEEMFLLSQNSDTSNAVVNDSLSESPVKNSKKKKKRKSDQLIDSNEECNSDIVKRKSIKKREKPKI